MMYISRAMTDTQFQICLTRHTGSSASATMTLSNGGARIGSMSLIGCGALTRAILAFSNRDQASHSLKRLSVRSECRGVSGISRAKSCCGARYGGFHDRSRHATRRGTAELVLADTLSSSSSYRPGEETSVDARLLPPRLDNENASKRKLDPNTHRRYRTH